MKKIIILSVCLATVVLIWGQGVSPCLAYYPPLTDITGPTVTQDGGITKVTFSVHNPATNQNIPYVWSTAGGAGTISIDQIYNVQGMVAWRVINLTGNSYQVFCAVYDPNRGARDKNHPEWGWQLTGTWEPINHETNILDLKDGLFLYETHYTDGTQTNAVNYFCTYDPTPPPDPEQMWYGWTSYSHSFSNYNGALPRNHILKDGVGAFIYDGRNTHMIYLLFDGHTQQWRYETEWPANPTAPQISGATVTWSDDSGLQKRGYDYTDQTWKPGLDTKVMAYYVFAPLTPRPNQPVWFTDVSIAGTSWSYDLGDKVTTSARSFYHKYASGGKYLVKQNVTGPAGTNANTQTVAVLSSPSVPLMLLLFH
jgi:PKD repeat protein